MILNLEHFRGMFNFKIHFEHWVLTIHAWRAASDSKQSTLRQICPTPPPELLEYRTASHIQGKFFQLKHRHRGNVTCHHFFDCHDFHH